jgi:hypothetical protein
MLAVQAIIHGERDSGSALLAIAMKPEPWTVVRVQVK